MSITMRYSVIKYLLICIGVSFIITILINFWTNSLGDCECNTHSKAEHGFHQKLSQEHNEDISDDPKKKKLAIIVPFRDRFDELLKFAPHMTSFLKQQKIPHHIFVVNQADRYRFNRASLINVGHLYTKHQYDYIAMHDVDLLPLNSNLKYEYPEKGPYHVAAPGLHPKYNYPTFIGGILLLKMEDFVAVNGMSNKYWGWGLEDDEFYVRLKDAGLQVHRPTDILTDHTNTFFHNHDRLHRRRDTTKCYSQKEETRKRDVKTGLNTIDYNISEVYQLTIDGIKVTILNVHLKCDKTFTPWCDCDSAPKEPTKSKVRKGL